MKLEKRVEMLEQELQVLKGQIQATLLDIQEQVLTNAYPSLKGGDVEPTSNVQQELKRVMSIPAEGSASRPMSDAVSSIPLVKQVSLNDLADSTSSLAPKSNLVPFPQPQVISNAVPAPASSAVPARSQETDWNELAELEDWVLKKIKEMGAKRARNLVYLYWQNGHLTLEQRDTLAGLVALYDVEVPEPRKTKSVPAATVQEKAPAPKKAPAKGPASQPKQKQPAPVRKPQATPAAQNGAKTKSTVQTMPQVKKTATTTVAHVENNDDSKQNTVLRLIAGINNASAGVIWGKKK